MFQHDFDKANKVFRQEVWPIIQPHLGGGTLLVLPQQDELLKKLDVSCGIDELQLLPNGAMRSLAVRVQYDQHWSSFTIRHRKPSGYQTEKQKRLFAIQQDCI